MLRRQRKRLPKLKLSKKNWPKKQQNDYRFDNLSGDPAQDFFVEGMHDALITQLSKINSLHIISQTTAMHYAGSDKPLREIAQELNVDAAVEGSVLRAGDVVRVTTQLIDAKTSTAR